jgi:uncharacterized protein (DUF362 family)
MIPFSQACSADKKVGPRKGKGNLFKEDGKPLLVVVEGKDVEKMLDKGLELLGGIDKIINKNDDIFLKPNYGSHRAYPTGSDPNFLVSIANRLKQTGSGNITICDSSDAYVLNRYNDYQYVFKENNVFETGKKAGIEVICTHPTDEKEYISVYSDKWTKNPLIRANKHMLPAPVIINQPMLKRHGNAFMTCALKNFFGAVFQPQRMDAHNQLRNNDEAGKDFFMKTIAEFADAIRPELTIVDARQIMTVKGPSLKKDSVIKDVNKLILSGDMVATDTYCAQILDENDVSFKKEMILPTLEYAQKLGLGTMDLSQVKVKEVTV